MIVIWEQNTASSRVKNYLKGMVVEEQNCSEEAKAEKKFAHDLQTNQANEYFESSVIRK